MPQIIRLQEKKKTTKITMRYCFTLSPPEMAKMKNKTTQNLTIPNAGKNVEQLEPYELLVSNSTTTLEKQVRGF